MKGATEKGWCWGLLLAMYPFFFLVVGYFFQVGGVGGGSSCGECEHIFYIYVYGRSV